MNIPGLNMKIIFKSLVLQGFPLKAGATQMWELVGTHTLVRTSRPFLKKKTKSTWDKYGDPVGLDVEI